MKQLIMLIIIPLVSYSMEKNLKYFEMLPNEVTELIIALIPEASNANTLAQSARAIAPLSLVNKPMARVTLEILQRYKNQNDYVDLFLSNAQKFENVIFDLPKELTLNTDICTLRTISQRLQKDQTIIPGIRDVFKTCNKFEADDLEQCLQANKKEADALLIEKFNDLDTYENYTRAACQRTYDEVTISDMIVLLKNGADPNQMTVSSFGEQIPLLHQICVLGNKLLVEALLDHGADINSQSTVSNRNVLEWQFMSLFTQTPQDKIEKMDLLISRGISLTKTDFYGNGTVLDTAYIFEEQEVIDFLRSKGAKTYQELQDEDL